jgi:coenzyme F420-reducing hydrogenase beta subunit
LNHEQKPVFAELYDRVISPPGICSGCGACILICPKDRLVFRDYRPEQVSGERGECPENREGRCGLCVTVCPRLDRLNSVEESPSTKNPTEMLAARSTDEALRERAQDGGLVSGLLRWGLDTHTWSSCLGYARDEAWQVQPLVVTDSRDVARASGSKYTYVPIHEGLRLLQHQGRSSEPFAVVGPPCHVEAIRKLQKLHSKHVRGLALTIGLFCTKAFSYERLIRGRFVQGMGISPGEVEKMDIRKGVFVIEMTSGSRHEIPLKELQDNGHPGCASCADFAAEGADISVGGLGISGWTMALTRTAAGTRALHAAHAGGYLETAPADRFPKAVASLEKMSAWKRANAART